MAAGAQLISTLGAPASAREMIDQGKLGKVVQFQTECFRNSRVGMSRHNEIAQEITPQNIDWRRWLGVDEGLAPEIVFDRAVYGQWRCYWPFGYGMFSDLLVHRVTGTLKKETREAHSKYNFDMSHFDNFLAAIRAGRPDMVNNGPELGAAAVMMVNLAVQSYREGKVFHIDREGNIAHGDRSWSDGWERMSHARSKPRHVPGWRVGDTGSVMSPCASGAIGKANRDELHTR
jgi:hypothetical protein